MSPLPARSWKRLLMTLPVPQANHFCTKEADAEQFIVASQGTVLLLVLHGSRMNPTATPDTTTKHKKNNIFTVCSEESMSEITM